MRTVFFTVPGLIALYLALRTAGSEQAALVLVAAAAFVVVLWNASLRD